MSIFEVLAEYFSYEFVWFALIAGTLIDTLRIALFSAVESRFRKGRDK